VAIEGPLRELGIHDVFQLLDLSRKTGSLTVTSALRDNHGTVLFDRGSVVFASIRTNPHPLGELLLRAGRITDGDLTRARELQARGDHRKLGEILVSIGAINRKELERHVRFQVEEVIFELMSWREGYFSFEEQATVEAPTEADIRISTESLLMEAARRIDEWSRIESKVAHLGMVPVLASVSEDHPTLLDLLPNEWEVLAEIDGGRDLRDIATRLARSEFDVAKIVYGLVATGVVELRQPKGTKAPVDGSEEAAPHVMRALAALRSGAVQDALTAARQALASDPHSAEARLALARSLGRLGRHGDAAEELRRALQHDALHPDIHLELGYSAAWRGEYEDALAAWERYLRMAPDATDAGRVREAAETAGRLRTLLQEHTGA
jgi:tetratricopeptide (TPR) repeat protein